MPGRGGPKASVSAWLVTHLLLDVHSALKDSTAVPTSHDQLHKRSNTGTLYYSLCLSVRPTSPNVYLCLSIYLSLCLSICVRLSVSASLCLPLLCASIHPSLRLSVSPSHCLSDSPSIVSPPLSPSLSLFFLSFFLCLSLSLSLHLSLSIYLSLSVRLSLSLALYLSLSVYISPSLSLSLNVSPCPCRSPSLALSHSYSNKVCPAWGCTSNAFGRSFASSSLGGSREGRRQLSCLLQHD